MTYGAPARTGLDTAVFAACLVLSLTALALPEGVRAPVAGALRTTVLFPLLSVERQTVRSAEQRALLVRLRAERDSLALRAADAPQLADENRHLRALVGLGRRLGAGFVAADVLHQAGVTDGLTLVLSAGGRQGVAPLSPVVAPEGLVGLVHAVDRHTSVALAWTHPDFRASAMVDGVQVYGIVASRRGAKAGELMELRGVAYRDQLAPGTPVVTSGLGGIFPAGIPIGTVQGILDEEAGWERTYLLRPAIHPAAAKQVVILSLARSADTLTTLFRDSLVVAPADTSAARRAPGRP